MKLAMSSVPMSRLGFCSNHTCFLKVVLIQTNSDCPDNLLTQAAYCTMCVAGKTQALLGGLEMPVSQRRLL